MEEFDEDTLNTIHEIVSREGASTLDLPHVVVMTSIVNEEICDVIGPYISAVEACKAVERQIQEFINLEDPMADEVIFKVSPLRDSSYLEVPVD